MKVKLVHIQKGFENWYLKDVAPLGWKAMLATPIISIAIKRFLTKNHETISLISDEKGEVDIDELHKEYAEIINKAGSIELSGIKFNVQDLDSLVKSIKEECPTGSAKE